MEAADRDRAVKVIILTGAGRGFCSGADMNDLTNISAAGGVESRPFEPFDPNAKPDYQHPQTWFASVSKPIIAAINGPCAGMGLCISLFCDQRFVSETAVFVTAFSRRGLIAEHGTSWMLPRIVGHSRALDLLLSSRRVHPDEAYRIGLADRVFAPEALIEGARTYARELSEAVSPRSMAVIKRQLWNGLVQDLKAAMVDA